MDPFQPQMEFPDYDTDRYWYWQENNDMEEEAQHDELEWAMNPPNEWTTDHCLKWMRTVAEGDGFENIQFMLDPYRWRQVTGQMLMAATEMQFYDVDPVNGLYFHRKLRRYIADWTNLYADEPNCQLDASQAPALNAPIIMQGDPMLFNTEMNFPIDAEEQKENKEPLSIEIDDDYNLGAEKMFEEDECDVFAYLSEPCSNGAFDDLQFHAAVKNTPPRGTESPPKRPTPLLDELLKKEISMEFSMPEAAMELQLQPTQQEPTTESHSQTDDEDFGEEVATPEDWKPKIERVSERFMRRIKREAIREELMVLAEQESPVTRSKSLRTAALRELRKNCSESPPSSSSSEDSGISTRSKRSSSRKVKKPKRLVQESESNDPRSDPNLKLWQFLIGILERKKYRSIICWQNKAAGIFQVQQPEELAELWGDRRGNPRMSYEKLSRAMRHYYRNQMLVPMPRQKMVYQFGARAMDYLHGSC